MQSVVALLLLALGATSAQASFSREKQVAILAEAIQGSANSSELIQKSVTELRKDPDFCPKLLVKVPGNSPPAMASFIGCLRLNIGDIIRRAAKAGVLDSVEEAVLYSEFTAVAGVDAEGKVELVPRLREIPGGRGQLNIPKWDDYTTNKRDFAKLLRAGKEGATPQIDTPANAELLKQLEDAYRRTMKGVSKRLTPEQYFAATLGPNGWLKLNRVAQIALSLAQRISLTSATIQLAPSGYAQALTTSRTNSVLESDLTQRILGEADSSRREVLRKELRDLVAKRKELAPALRVDALRAEIQLARAEQEKIADALAISDITDATERASKLKDMERTDKAIDDAEFELQTLTRGIALSASDVTAVSLNTLRHELDELNREPSFAGHRVAPGDVLLAGWVAGDLASDELKDLMSFRGMDETHVSAWRKTAVIAWKVGQTSLALIPAASYITASVNILIQARQDVKDFDKRQADRGRIIPYVE